MTLTEHLLCCLAEEANEVAHRVSKALRFGLEEVQDGQPLTNSERIVHEFVDMLAIYELLEEHGVIARNLDLRKPIDRKKQKVANFLDYSKICGTLDEPVRQQRDELLQAFDQAMAKIESATACHPNAVRFLFDEAIEIWGTATSAMRKGGAK